MRFTVFIYAGILALFVDKEDVCNCWMCVTCVFKEQDVDCFCAVVVLMPLVGATSPAASHCDPNKIKFWAELDLFGNVGSQVR